MTDRLGTKTTTVTDKIVPNQSQQQKPYAKVDDSKKARKSCQNSDVTVEVYLM